MEIVAVSSEEKSSAGGVASVVQQLGLTFPIIHDPSNKISELYPTNGIPYVIFIDKSGKVVNTVMGLNEDIGKEIADTFGLS